MSSRHCAALVMSAALAVIPGATAQCDPQWLPTGGIHGVGGYPGSLVQAMALWDADGAGPNAPQLVLGGKYRIAGNAAANCIASLDLASSQWTAISEGISPDYGFGPQVKMLLPVAKSGGGFDLIVGGYFSGAGGTAVTNLARWDGSGWSPVGIGTTASAVTCAAALPNGDLLFAGEFVHVNGTQVNYIARWDGVAWSPLGAGFNNPVASVGVLPNGDVVAGGLFTTSGGVPVGYIARWNGATWSQLGTGVNSPVRAIVVAPDGDVYAGGQFTVAGSNARSNIAQWDGTTWNALGAGLNARVNALALAPNGDLIAGGAFTQSGTSILANNVARWDGTAWHGFSNGVGINTNETANAAVNSVIVLPTGEVVVGGLFHVFGGVAVDHAALWNGSSWQPLPTPPGDGMDGNVLALASTQDGVIATGEFRAAGNAEARRIACHNGTQWVAMGAGLTGTPTSRGQAVEVLPSGDVYAGGTFNNAGGIPAQGLAKWNGTTWLETGYSGSNVTGLATLPDGAVAIASVQTGCARRWNGSAWTCITGNYTAVAVGITSLETFPNGDVFVGGRIRYQPNVFEALNIGRWNGTQWDASLKLDDPVHALLAVPTGSGGTDLYACGEFDNATAPNIINVSKIARWDGTQWLPLGSGLNYTARAMALAADGSLIVGGDFNTAGGAPANRVARWDGTQWHPLGGGANAEVYSVAGLANGDIMIGGLFTKVDDKLAAHFARWGVPMGCPRCDTVDFNGDGLFPDVQDIADFLSVFSGGVCAGQQPGDPPCNGDIDFNNDSILPDAADIGALLRVFSGGAC